MTISFRLYTDIVSLKQIARIIKLDRSRALHIVQEAKFPFAMRVTPDSNHQKAMTFTREVAEMIINHRLEQGHSIDLDEYQKLGG